MFLGDSFLYLRISWPVNKKPFLSPFELPNERISGTRLHVQRLAVETTWRCQKNPFIGALGIQEPVIPGEPLFKG